MLHKIDGYLSFVKWLSCGCKSLFFSTYRNIRDDRFDIRIRLSKYIVNTFLCNARYTVGHHLVCPAWHFNIDKNSIWIIVGKKQYFRFDDTCEEYREKE